MIYIIKVDSFKDSQDINIIINQFGTIVKYICTRQPVF